MVNNALNQVFSWATHFLFKEQTAEPPWAKWIPTAANVAQRLRQAAPGEAPPGGLDETQGRAQRSARHVQDEGLEARPDHLDGFVLFETSVCVCATRKNKDRFPVGIDSF